MSVDAGNWPQTIDGGGSVSQQRNSHFWCAKQEYIENILIATEKNENSSIRICSSKRESEERVKAELNSEKVETAYPKKNILFRKDNFFPGPVRTSGEITITDTSL